MTAAPERRRVGIAELERRLAMDRSTVWRWYRAGKFPAPHYIGVRRCWWLEEIEKWEREQLTRPAPPSVGNAFGNR